MDAGKIVVTLDLEAAGFTRSATKAGVTINTMSKKFDKSSKSVNKVNKSFSSLATRMRDSVIVLSQMRGALQTLNDVFIALPTSIISTSAEIERMTMLMKGMSTESDSALKKIDAIGNVNFTIDLAKNTPFQLKTLTDSFVKLKSVGIDPTDGSLQALSDAVATFGGTSEQFHRASIAIQQMSGKGVISMEELRQQLGEAVPNAISILARSMKMTYRQLVDQISKGNVQAGGALKKMFAQMELEMGGASERMMKTFVGMTQRMGTEWLILKKTAGDAGFFDETKNALGELITLMSSQEMSNFAESVGRGLTMLTKGVVYATKFLLEHGKVILGVIGTYAAFKVTAMALTAVAAGSAVVWGVLTKSLIGMEIAAMLAGKTSAVLLATTLTLQGGIQGLIGLMKAHPAALVLAVAALAYKLNEVSNTTKDAIKNIQDLFHIDAENLTEQQIDDLTESVEDLELQIKKVEKMSFFERMKRGFTNTFGGGISNEEEANAAKNSVTIGKHQLQQAEEAKAKKAAKSYIKSIMIGTEEALADAQSKYTNTIGTSAKKFNEGGNKDYGWDEANRDQLEALSVRTKKEIEIHESLARDQYAIAKKAGEDGKEVAQRNALAAAKYIEDLLVKKQQRQMDLKRDLDKEIPGLDAKGSTDKNAKVLATQVANLTSKLAQLKEEGDSGFKNSYLAKMTSLVESGKFGKSKKAIEELLSLAKQVDDQTSDNKAEAAMDKLREKIGAVNVKLGEASNKAGTFDAYIKNLSVGEIDKTKLVELEALFDKLIIKQDQLVDKKHAEKMTKSYNKITKTLGESIAKSSIAVMSERDATIATYDAEIGELERLTRSSEAYAENRIAIETKLKDAVAGIRAEQMKALRTPMQKLNDDWQDMSSQMQDATADWARKSTDAIVEFAKTGKFEFKDMVTSMLADLLRMQVQQSVTGPLFEAMSKGLSSYFGGASASPTTASSYGVNGASYNPSYATASANGNIMTSAGPVKLSKYSTGGIANSPQLSLFGEGSKPEAYVPLPDGRSIPVSMEGGGGSNVQVNVINESGTDVDAYQTGQQFDGEKMILDVVMKAINKPGPLRSSMKGVM